MKEMVTRKFCIALTLALMSLNLSAAVLGGYDDVAPSIPEPTPQPTEAPPPSTPSIYLGSLASKVPPELQDKVQQALAQFNQGQAAPKTTDQASTTEEKVLVEQITRYQQQADTQELTLEQRKRDA